MIGTYVTRPIAFSVDYIKVTTIKVLENRVDIRHQVNNLPRQLS